MQPFRGGSPAVRQTRDPTKRFRSKIGGKRTWRHTNTARTRRTSCAAIIPRATPALAIVTVAVRARGCQICALSQTVHKEATNDFTAMENFNIERRGPSGSPPRTSSAPPTRRSAAISTRTPIPRLRLVRPLVIAQTPLEISQVRKVLVVPPEGGRVRHEDDYESRRPRSSASL